MSQLIQEWTTHEDVNNKKQKKKKINKSNIIKPKYNIIDNEKPEDITSSTIICKHCKTPFVWSERNDEYDENENPFNSREESKFFECPKCGTSNTIKEYRKLLTNNFFNKKNERKKTKNKPRRTLG